MILDDYDIVSPRSEQQVRNAYAAAAWRQQYNRRAWCPDLRNDELRARGERIAIRMEDARKYVRLSERTKLAIQRAFEMERRALPRVVLPFRRKSRR